jgi:diguanylate cyclase
MARNKNIGPGERQPDAPDHSPARLLRTIARLEREVVLARRFAYHDPLTGLPNRAMLRDRLGQAVAQAARQNKRVGVLLVDLDGFKGVNDELGHHAGDAILKSVAERLLGCIRACDTACRYGGDEFVILLPEIRGQVDLEKVKRKICEHLRQPYRLGKRSLSIGASIGSALFSEEARSSQALINLADAAMYRAKRAAKGPRAAASFVRVQRSETVG